MKGHSLLHAFDTPDRKRAYVQRLFSTIAPRYDLITILLSYGQDRRWKRRLLSLVEPGGGERVLDLACGTGDLAFAAAGRGAHVAGLDLAWPMLVAARRREPGSRVVWLQGDMSALPFSDGSFDVVTTGYGLRNVPMLDRALAEIARVLRPGGRVAALDFDRPANRVVRGLYLGYLTFVGSALGWLLHGDADTYRYIPASIRRYPGAAHVAVLFRQAGFADVGHLRVLGGLMAIHVAAKPG